MEGETRGGCLSLLRARGGALCNTNGGWEKVTLLVDSGASDTVIPPSICSAAPLQHESLVGTKYEVANGADVDNLAERACTMRTSTEDERGFAMLF